MNELDFSRRLRPTLASEGFSVKNFQHVNGELACPDLLVIRKGEVTWIEAKVVRDGRVKFRPGQIQWMKRWIRDGGKAMVITFCPGGLVWLLSSDKAGALRDSKGLGPDAPPDILGLVSVDCRDGWANLGPGTAGFLHNLHRPPGVAGESGR